MCFILTSGYWLLTPFYLYNPEFFGSLQHQVDVNHGYLLGITQREAHVAQGVDPAWDAPGVTVNQVQGVIAEQFIFTPGY